MQQRFFITATRYPSVTGDITDRENALRERESIRARLDDEAWRLGYTHVHVVDCHGDTVDSWPIEARRFAVQEGQRVVFPSRSATSRTRVGTVQRIEGTRARISYSFKHGGTSEKWVPMRLCRPARR